MTSETLLPSSFPQELRELPGVLLLENTALKAYSTLRPEGNGHVIELQNSESTAKLLRLLRQYKIPYQVVGLGSNQLLFDDYRCLYIYIHFPWEDPRITYPSPSSGVSRSYRFVASIPASVLTQFALRHKLQGFEVFTGIPASLGGLCFMNAGTSLGEVGDIIQNVEFYDPLGNFHVISLPWNPLDQSPKERAFSYRKNHFIPPQSIITHVTLRPKGTDEGIPQLIQDYLEKRKKTQPLKTKNCGCTFKNPPGFIAAKLIDDLGLKGYEHKGFRISPVHANFIEHFSLESGNARDFLELVEIIQEKVREKYGIELEMEIQSYGKSP